MRTVKSLRMLIHYDMHIASSGFLSHTKSLLGGTLHLPPISSEFLTLYKQDSGLLLPFG